MHKTILKTGGADKISAKNSPLQNNVFYMLHNLSYEVGVSPCTFTTLIFIIIFFDFWHEVAKTLKTGFKCKSDNNSIQENEKKKIREIFFPRTTQIFIHPHFQADRD